MRLIFSGIDSDTNEIILIVELIINYSIKYLSKN